WQKTTLGEVAEINPSTKGVLPHKFIYIDLEAVEKGVLLKHNIITKDNAPSRAQRLLKDHDVLFQMVRPYQQNNLYFRSVEKIPSVASTGYAQLRSVQSGRFLYYAIHSATFLGEVLNRCTGTNYPAINATDLSSLPLSLPFLAEQRKIAEFLSLIDERIETQRQTIEEYKNLRSATIKEISSRIVEWDSLESLVDNGVILLKRGEIIPKSEYSSTNQYPVYSSSVKNKGLMGYTDKFMFEDERITWSIDGGGDLFYRYPHKYSVTNVCGILEILGEYDYRFLCAILQRQHLRLRFNYQTKAHPSVIVKLYKVPRINLEQQVHYGALIASIDERIEVEEKLLGKYEEQKKYLLRKMFV
ncbi:restriction endonuclease subunit S, partial [Porphyromonas levii]